ncbi:MAG: quinone oxidoreductase [Hoeflea sp.]|uniref:quinone oxidoreductase family protein n=1 Tax=Hoeflea sp. TaxID=1940281 RepID=UPI001DFC9B85|nr:quinone oxidoreductase [Hoeflea sp.]MBU4529538.1 quinone oxidoreductase [Alphaproteobacteria bacterium]MBU4546657.1 quinone oxidoreductase [Alphaproteobacteria bacterium]MBU4550925.1 quinone oxidoreductase [Alphaproteobacteria bacterium]MBV1723867.1 quinone oxidoreductase [Hoeflea sp.]MBV1763144.1 quinone oxidoreductase [Hoeflea sp.]
MKAILVSKHGGPEVLEWRDHAISDPGAGEVRIRHEAVGLNFIDVYFRTGLYPAPNGLPLVPGNEGAGIVTAVGEGVTRFKEGDRIAYAGPIGAYAEERVIAAEKIVKVPDGIELDVAAGMMLKGMTAEYLLRRTHVVQPGDTILFHAAAGGVGLIAGQWAKALGATVIGTVGSAEKAELAAANGYDHVINYRTEDFVERVKDITGGKGVDVVYDSVGKDTFPGSLDCLRPRGLWASFGQSSGPIEPINIGILSQKGSLFATRPTLFTYIASREDLEASANALFDVVARGIVKIDINQRYKLAEAAQAHTDLEGRKTTGVTVLKP